RGTQIGSGSTATTPKPITSFSMETESVFEVNHISDILKITLETSGTSGTNATAMVTVGGVQIGNAYSVVGTGSGYSTATFASSQSLSGKIKISFNQTSVSGLYFHGVSIFGASVAGGVTPKQQASAFASYVLGLPACTMTDDAVTAMISEYDYMTSESKTFFNAMTNGSTLGKDRYEYILYLHPNAVSLDDGEFVPTTDVSVSKAPIWVIFIILPFAVMAATGLWVAMRRKNILD
ncbi:MAG: hypothetical protein NTV44_05775, partial [Firmicutes bacterium]|nr:hypothetical protein [Bacillota bacterium]